jgi:5'-3' exonuclease
MKLHLIDGTYELFRAYYGPPGAKSPSGQEVGATRGLIRSLSALLRESDVTHVAAAFDTRVESFRNDLFDGYKTGEGMEPELWEQFPLAERATSALGITVWSMIEFEADDALAAGARRFADQVDQVVLCSPDKDLYQCVRDSRIVCWDRMREKIYDEAAVRDKLGIAPQSVPDYLALVGDSADGIPGLPRWGAKSTSLMLAHYGTLEAIPEDEREWTPKVRGAAALAKVLREEKQNALLYKKLATLRTDVPLEEGLADLKWKGARPELQSFCEEIGMRPPSL